MNPMRAVLPSLALAAATLLAALPWGVPAGARLAPPLLVAALLFALDARRADAVPEWVAFASGVAMDVVSQGPLGFWAMLYLLAFALAEVLRPTPRVPGGALVGDALAYLAATGVVAAAAFGLASLYALQWAEAWPYAFAGVTVALAYPAVALAAGVLDPIARAGRQLPRAGGDRP